MTNVRDAVHRLTEVLAERHARDVAQGLSLVGRARFERYLVEERERPAAGAPAAAWRALERAVEAGCREHDPSAVAIAIHRRRRRGD